MRAWFRPGAERFGNGNVGAPLRRQFTGCFLQSNSSSLITSVGSPVLASERAPEHGSGGGMLVRR